MLATLASTWLKAKLWFLEAFKLSLQKRHLLLLQQMKLWNLSAAQATLAKKLLQHRLQMLTPTSKK